MQVHTIRVKYARSKQPKEYETASPEIEFVASVDDGEDHVDKARTLMRDACDTVYSALGINTPAQVARKLGVDEVSDEGKAEQTTKEAEVKKAEPKKEEKKEETKKDDSSDIPDDDGASNKRTPPAEGKKAEAKKDDASDIPGDDEPKGRAISDNPEDRKEDDSSDIPDDSGGAKADASDIPGDDGNAAEEYTEEEEPEFTNADLYEMVSKRVSSKEFKLTSAAVKEILAGIGVARVRDVPADKLMQAKEEIEAAG